MSTDKSVPLTRSNPASSAPANAGNVSRDTNRGNPNGDVVDNSEGVNPSRNQAKVYNTGSNLSGMSRPSFLNGIQSY